MPLLDAHLGCDIRFLPRLVGGQPRERRDESLVPEVIDRHLSCPLREAVLITAQGKLSIGKEVESVDLTPAVFLEVDKICRVNAAHRLKGGAHVCQQCELKLPHQEWRRFSARYAQV
ncbi:MAG: hypothetical protein V4673_09620 [Pseudomonadota bacterium]